MARGPGITTNNVAEYRDLILGLKYALQYGFYNIRVRQTPNLSVRRFVLPFAKYFFKKLDFMISSLMTMFHYILIFISLVP